MPVSHPRLRSDNGRRNRAAICLAKMELSSAISAAASSDVETGEASTTVEASADSAGPVVVASPRKCGCHRDRYFRTVSDILCASLVFMICLIGTILMGMLGVHPCARYANSIVETTCTTLQTIDVPLTCCEIQNCQSCQNTMTVSSMPSSTVLNDCHVLLSTLTEGTCYNQDSCCAENEYGCLAYVHDSCTVKCGTCHILTKMIAVSTVSSQDVLAEARVSCQMNDRKCVSEFEDMWPQSGEYSCYHSPLNLSTVVVDGAWTISRTPFHCSGDYHLALAYIVILPILLVYILFNIGVTIVRERRRP